MKTKWRFTLIIFIAFLLFPLQVLAVEYTINETEIHAHLKENGDVQVIESHTYTFEGEFNGITRSLIPKEGTSITNFKATENGAPLEVERENEMYSIYRSGEDEIITIKLSYDIKDGVEVYSDMGQFYWPFFDSSNESDYENFTVFVYPPKGTTDVIAYGFDEAQGTVQIQDNGSVVFHMGKVESGKNGDIRVAYDSELFPSASLHDGIIRDELVQESQELNEKQEAYENRKAQLGRIAPYIVVGFSIYIFTLLIFAWRKRRNTLIDAERQYTSTSFVPSEIMSMPATIYYFRNYMVGKTEMLTIGLMDLIRKKHILQREKDEYLVVNRNTEHKHETHLIRLLFDEIGENGVFGFKQLEKYIRDPKNQVNFQKHLHTWFKLLLYETESHQLFEKQKKLRWLAGITSVLFIPLMIIFGIHHLWVWIIAFALLMGGFLLFALFFQPRTVKGHILKTRWKQFKGNFSQVQSDRWYGLTEDEKERALVFSIGLDDPKLKEKSKTLIEKFNLSTEATSRSTLNTLFLLAFYSSATSSFGSATEVSALSSGSTPGTGTGVGGGGGGSGAF